MGSFKLAIVPSDWRVKSMNNIDYLFLGSDINFFIYFIKLCSSLLSSSDNILSFLL